MEENKDYYHAEDAERKADTLKKVKVDDENWKIYYVDEETGDSYVKVYLESHLQGGGPPSLIRISEIP